MNRSLPRLGLAAVALALTACASSPMPTTRVASSTAAVRSAHEVGADAIPDAALHVRMAEDELRTAQRLIRDGEPEKADMLLVRSQSDAELAIGITRASKAKASADEATNKLRSTSPPAPAGNRVGTPDAPTTPLIP